MLPQKILKNMCFQMHFLALLGKDKKIKKVKKRKKRKNAQIDN